MASRNSESFDFLKKFVGRDAELNMLIAGWDRTLNQCPQLVVLLADTGLGKTRLIHEFYRKIAAGQQHDPAEQPYWPEVLDENLVTLRLNPDISSGARMVEDLPWFWWGIRWQPPAKHNAEGFQVCGLFSGDAQKAIEAHREPLRRHLKKLGRMRSAGEVLGNALLSLIPFVGQGKTAYDLLDSLKDVLAEPGAGQTYDLAAVAKAYYRDIEDRFRGFLVALLDPKHKELPTVPVILVLDDAQWADATTLRFVRNLFVDATRNRWPLMVLATCWETDWKEHGAAIPEILRLEDDPATLHMLKRQLAELVAPQSSPDEWNAHYHEIVIPPLRDSRKLEPMIQAAFAGFGCEARQYLLDKADGNPMILSELLIQLQEQALPNWFNAAGDLTARGFERLCELPTAYEKIVARRIKRLAEHEPETFKVLEVASAQGMRFYGSLVGEMARAHPGGTIANVHDALKRGENPWNFITLLARMLYPGEFKDRTSRDQFHRTCIEEWPQAADELRRHLAAWLQSEKDKSDEESEPILRLLLDVHAELKPPASQPDIQIRALAWLVHGLQKRAHYGEAARRAKDILAMAAGMTKMALLELLPPPTRLSVMRCLLDAHEFGELVALVDEHLAQGKPGADADEVMWRRLKAHALQSREKYEDAMAAWHEAIDAARVAAPPPDRDRLLQLTRLYVGLGESCHMQKGWRDALDAFRKGLRVLRSAMAGKDPGFSEHRLFSQIYMGIAETLYDAGRLAGAVDSIRRSQRHLERCIELIGNAPQVLELLTQCLTRQGEWAQRLVGGDARSAVAVLGRALALRGDMIRIVGETAETLSALAGSHSLLAGALSQTGGNDEAVSHVEEAIRLRREVIRRVGNEITARRLLSFTLVKRGDINRALERLPEALRDYEAACEIREGIVHESGSKANERLRKDYRNLLYAWRKRGEIYLENGSLAEAQAALREALAYCLRVRRQFREFPADVIDFRNEYILCELFARLAEAENKFAKAGWRYHCALIRIGRLAQRHGLSEVGRIDETRIRAATDRLMLQR